MTTLSTFEASGMPTTGLVYHPDYIRHNLGQDHPEKPERISTTIRYLKRAGLLDNPEIQLFEPKPATIEDLTAIHIEDYVQEIQSLSKRGGILTLDTPVQTETYEIARLSAGGAIQAGEIITRGEVKNSFALVRPPGHHAGRGYGGGFCYFNNVCVMIEHLRRKFGLKRFMIIDWDVHHGNGTQDIFYGDPTVLYFSTHQMPLYPGTGYMEEIGEGEGRGFNVNLPLPAGTSGDVYDGILDEIVSPLVEEFRPEFIAVSAGQDAHYADPIANLEFTSCTYANITRKLLVLTHKFCRDKLALVLEGGYNLEALPASIASIVTALADLPCLPVELKARQEVSRNQEIEERIKKLKSILKEYWNSFR
jgi:acetoin utilization deacetylase AcuC-like enzyme